MRGHRARAAAIGLALAAAHLAWPAAAPAAGPQALAVTLAGANGVGDLVTDGLSCAEGGEGSYRHYRLDAPLPAGKLSAGAGVARATIDVHHDVPVPVKGSPGFLLGTESHVTLSNQRGSLQLRMAGGSCQASSLTFTDPTHVTGGGALTDPVGTGAYRQATFTGGTYQLAAEVAPGADNQWSLAVAGQVGVLQPSLSVQAVETFWGGLLGADYALRTVSVTYQVTNSGPGDAFGATLVTTTSPTNGVTPRGPVPQPLGDLYAGDRELVTVKYQLGLLEQCALVVLGCAFDTVVGVTLPDALDVPATSSAAVPVSAPDFPPPL